MMPVRLTLPVLVIGVGNDLRGDDAAGWFAAEAARGRIGVTVIRVRQLVPELAVDVAKAASVVLIDAAIDESAMPSLHPVSATRSLAAFTHSASASDLLALAARLHGRTPDAWLIGIPAESFEYGAAPSPRCQAGIETAVRWLAAALPEESMTTVADCESFIRSKETS